MLGFAFKKDTNDTRESAAIIVCRDLLEEQAQLAIYDPKVPAEQTHHDLRLVMTTDENQLDESVTICDSVYEATTGAHAILILTEWDEFKELDFERIHSDMHLPA